MFGPIRYLHHFFEEQVTIRPDALALVGMKTTITYKAVHEYTNQLAHFLRENGVSTGDMVGLYFNRSELPILAILGILKAGAGYVPIDPIYPEDRIQHILNDASIKVILSEDELFKIDPINFTGKIFLIDKEKENINKFPKNSIRPNDINLSENSLCYIIYTSGSTGKPKGVMTEHRNIVSFVHSFKKACKLSHQDRIYQGFSFGFDGSVEEIWMAFANGAALITGTNDLSKLAAETAQYLTQQKVTYFSTVPTFLSMIKEDLPTVKLLVVSGEACPQELVDIWAVNGRRMLNVYGPTEATVNTTAAECIAGREVTIGKPLDGYDTFILNEHMQPVKSGEQGELYVGGPGLSRGYMNLPEMTNKAFIPTPPHLKTTSNRIYKTGDLVSLTNNNEFKFYGRIDLQVKIRGYRIELSEIEAILREHPLVHASAVKPYQSNGITELASFIVLKKGIADINRDEIIDLLKKKLPIYMVPSYLDVITELPVLSSGKTDRKKLPEPSTPLIKKNRIIVAPETKVECELLDILKELFKTPSISIEDDFFMDLGGYSLIAAQYVSEMRKKFSYNVAIRDIYKFPSVKKLSEFIESAEEDASSRFETISTQQKMCSQVHSEFSKITQFTCILFQAITIAVFCGIVSSIILGSLLVYKEYSRGIIPIQWIVYGSIALFIGIFPLMLLLSITAKWLIIGKFKPGSYPIYSMYYFRWWLVTRIQRMNGAALLAGTPFMNFYFRLMGSKIGKNCVINTSLCSIYDLFSIGNDSSIGFETQIPGYRVENGLLKIGSINIGKNCFVGIQASIGLNSVMNDSSYLDDQSFLPDNKVMMTGESCKGSPAQFADVYIPNVKDVRQKSISNFSFTLLSLFSFYSLELFLALAAMPSALVMYLAFVRNDWLTWISLLIIAIPLFEFSFWTLMIITKNCILGKTKTGIFPVKSTRYIKKWTIDSLLHLSRLFTLPIYTTLYAIPLLRLLGIKIGSRAELSVLSYVSPDIVELGPESFFADGSIIGGIRIFNGSFEIQDNKIGRRSFIGNSALLSAGKSVGDNCLIGVLSTTPENVNKTPDGTEWLGCPSFQLPHRKKVEGFTDTVIFTPSKKLYAARLFIDALRIAIPSGIEIASLVGIILSINYVYNHFNPFFLILSLPLIGILFASAIVLSVVIVKNFLIGTYTPVIKPLWSPYVWLNEVINGVYESVAAPILSPLLGTPFFAFFLRMFGAKVGKHVFIETTLFGEFDLVEIDDFAALNVDVIVQNHLFEDRIFKSSKLKIGRNCSLGNMAVILYDAEMLEGSSISSLSLIMKGEIVPRLSQWEGIPIKNKLIKETGKLEYATAK